MQNKIAYASFSPNPSAIYTVQKVVSHITEIHSYVQFVGIPLICLSVPLPGIVEQRLKFNKLYQMVIEEYETAVV